MKAKMKDKPAEVGKYICENCNIVFFHKNGLLVCPICRNGARVDMVLIDVQDNPKEEQMYSKDDWHGG